MNLSESLELLGVSGEAGTEEVRAAYMALLPSYHPEDDPQGFIRLREAYDSALAALNGGNAEVNGQEVESDPFTAKIKQILSDFPLRMNDEAWRDALAPEVAAGLDQQESASQKLLTLLMNNYFLPRRIWQLFDEYFAWSAREARLKEVFPPRFIDFVLSGMRYERALRDVFFDFDADAGEDFDAFIDAYHRLAEAMWSDDTEKAVKLAREYDGRLATHPDYRLLLARLSWHRGDREEAYAIMRELESKWPDDPFILAALGRALAEDGRVTESLEINLRALAANPRHYGARLGVSRARFDMGAFEEAKADAYELLMLDPYDTEAISVFRAANDALVPGFQERLSESPDDHDVLYKLASCYFNLGAYEKALALIENVTPDEDHRAKHYEYYADLFILTSKEIDDEDKQVLFSYLEAWEEAETDRERLRFLPDKYHKLGFSDTALDKVEIFLREFPSDPELCRTKAMILFDRGDLSGAFAAADEGLKKDPGNVGLLSVETYLHDAAGNPSDAAECAETALAAFPFNIELWEILARIHARAGQFEAVLDIIKRSKEYELVSLELSLMEATALFEMDDPKNEAIEIFENILEHDRTNTEAIEKLGVLYARAGRFHEAETLFDLYIAIDETPYSYLLRGWLFASCPRPADGFSKARARADFRRALELDASYAPAYFQLGVIAYDDGCMEEAVADFQRTLEIDPAFGGVRVYLAVALTRIGDVTAAINTIDTGLAQTDKVLDAKAYSKLLLKKADILYDDHRYAELADMGEEPYECDQATARPVRLGILGYALFQTCEDDRAEAYLKKALEEFQKKTEDNAENRELINGFYGEYLLYAKKDPASALQYFMTANEENASLQSVLKRARAYESAGHISDAEKLYRLAAALSRRDPGICSCFVAGACYYGLRKYKKAKTYLRRAVDGARDNVNCIKRVCYEALYALALIALQEQDMPAARDYYRQVLEIIQDREYLAGAPLFE